MAEELALLVRADFADEVDVVLLEQRLDLALEVLAIGVVDLRGDARQAGAARDLDGAIGALLGRHPAEEREVALGLQVRQSSSSGIPW